MAYTQIYDLASATVAEADTYHAARGNSTWAGAESVKEVALARARDYVDTLRWQPGIFDDSVKGTRAREAAKNAQIVGALRELVTPGVLLPDLTADNFLKSDDIAGMKTAYRADAPAGTVVVEINAIVRPYVTGRANVELRRG